MIDQSLAHPEHETIPEYVLRGHGLFELYCDEILDGYQGAGKWLIPSGSTSGSVYERLGRGRTARWRRECRGFASHGRTVAT